MSVAAEFARTGLNFLSDLIYPRACLHCGDVLKIGERSPSIRDVFCHGCFHTLKPVEQSCGVCPVCAVPYLSEAALSHSPNHLCGMCREDPPLFSHAIIPFRYEGALVSALHAFKYKKKTYLAKPLAHLLASRLTSCRVDQVVAIPLHPKRFRMREFNQALLLAAHVAKMLSLPLNIDALTRVKAAPSQVGLSRKGRYTSVKGAFFALQPEAIKGYHILLVDDVYTTGATLREGAKTLMGAGAHKVTVAALARRDFVQ